MFIDEVRILVKAGDGGNGCLAFRREKFVPRGGPSGGDGGRGGDVVMVASQQHNTLLQFRFNPEHKAQRGRHGEGSNRTGAEGFSIDVKVPVGTVVYDDSTGERLYDFTQPDERFTVAHGGKGGKNGARDSPPPRTRPPRSTSRASRARKRPSAWAEAAGRCGASGFSERRQIHPHFPYLGGAAQDRRLPFPAAWYPTSAWSRWIRTCRCFVVADIPGLIEVRTAAASRRRFLRHIERTPAGTWWMFRTPPVATFIGKDFETVLRELASFSGLVAKPMIVVAAKMDAVQDTARVDSCAVGGRPRPAYSEISSTPPAKKLMR